MNCPQWPHLSQRARLEQHACLHLEIPVPEKAMCAVLSHDSHVQIFVIQWTVACQALSTGFSRQEYWGSLPFLSTGNLPNPGIESASLTSPALAGRIKNLSISHESISHESNSLEFLGEVRMTSHGLPSESFRP